MNSVNDACVTGNRTGDKLSVYNEIGHLTVTSTGSDSPSLTMRYCILAMPSFSGVALACRSSDLHPPRSQGIDEIQKRLAAP